MNGRRGWGALSLALAVLAAALLLAAAVVGYAEDAFFDADEFADRATAPLEDAAVRDEIAARITDDVILRAEADLVGVRSALESVASGVVGSGAFQSLLRDAVADLHRALLEGDEQTLVVTVADIGSVVRGAVAALRPKLAERIPPGLDSRLLDEDPPDAIVTAGRVAEDLRILAPLLLLGGLCTAALAVLAAGDRRRATARLGIAVMIAGVLGVVALGLAREVVTGAVEGADARQAASALWQAFLGDLRNLLILFAAAGAVIAAAAAALLRTVDINEPLRAAWRLATTPPARPLARGMRAVGLIALGALIVLRHETAVQLAVISVGLYVAYVGFAELIRLTLPGEPSAGARDGASEARRAFAGASVAALAIIVAGSLFVVGGGTDEAPAASPPVRCNGSEELCERPVDEVVFPGTHNAMSAVTNPGWLFGQQDAGLAEQLADGVRALFIDAHYGTPTADGTIKTDLSDINRGERATYEAELGPEALDAALRIRDRIVGSRPAGETGIYLCHRFCELGALPIEEAFAELRDFLDASPGAVVLVVIEDYVAPDDIAEAVGASGLDPFVYAGDLDPPPALAEIAPDDGRAVMLAEQDAGDNAIPWYHEAYAGLVQETPYSFATPESLAKDSAWPASCRPNRGASGSPLLLLNHWVDTSPAPRPSNADVVNARRALRGRIEECERRRDTRVNVVSVDFYRRGDLFEVVADLNARGPEAG